jgi:two-component system chemotaxis sensor kinase CheA
MTELRQLFFESAGELVQKLNDEAMLLEKSPGDTEITRSLRRTVHTLKGDAAACGFRELSELSHEFEDVLTLENTASAALVPEIALRAADVFAALLEAYRKGTKLPNIQSIRADIASLAHSAPTTASKATPKKKQPAVKPGPWSEYDQLAIARAIADGKQVHHVNVDLDPQCGMPIVARRMIQLALAGLGEVLALYPDEASTEPMTRLDAALASEKSADQIRSKCSIPTVSLKVQVRPLRVPEKSMAVSAAVNTGDPASTEKDKDNNKEKNNDKDKRRATTREAEPARSEAPAHMEMPVSPSGASGPDSLLRVDAERIDSVLNLVGELILAKSMLQQALLEFGERFPKDLLRGKFSDAMAFQSRVLNDLQHSVMKIRMVPVEQLFRRFPRTVRDVAIQCGKEVELIVKGGQTDLDKSILDSIAEPLTHLVRNAIGHGIELPDERVRAGKSAQGTLRLGAYHQGNQVVIEVSDDGAGIDVEKVRRRAVSQGLITAEQAASLTETETLDLILQPGFSTAKEITELSGRGVGLDVVHSVLARLKGTVQIETVPGKGTTFRLRLPLTLAIIRALLFRVEHRLYALPLNAVAEITRTFEGDIHQVEHYDVLQLRNDVLPLLRLGSKPESGPETSRHKIFVLVINSGDRKFGLLVDAIEGEEELVIKALDDHSITTDLVSGASILGDGRVVLILNMIALMDRFTRGRADANGLPMTGLLSNAFDANTSSGGIASLEMRSRATAGGRA